jgi:hypothetical protein
LTVVELQPQHRCDSTNSDKESERRHAADEILR